MSWEEDNGDKICPCDNCGKHEYIWMDYSLDRAKDSGFGSYRPSRWYYRKCTKCGNFQKGLCHTGYDDTGYTWYDADEEKEYKKCVISEL